MVWVFVGIGLGIATLAHVAPFKFLIDAAAPAGSIWRMPQSAGQRAIYLTFDDGPNPTATPQLLDLLARERVSASFFVIDRHLSAPTAPIVRRMFEEGHTVALHSHTRRNMVRSPADLAATLTAAAARIEQLAGERPCRAFRPHGGGRSAMMVAGLARIDHPLIGWSWMMWDWDWWRKPTPERTTQRILQRASPGAIIVLHDGHHENPRADRLHTVATVAALIPALRAQGFTFETICDGGIVRRGA